MKFPKQLFITGTDTGIGKTFISAVICEGTRSYYWKPIQSGRQHPTDIEWVKNHTSLPENHFLPEIYLTNEPLSPHLSAHLDGIEIHLEMLSLPENIPENKNLIIEGAGGLMVPLNKDALLIDLIEIWNIPTLIVSKSSLGTINHTLLTIEKLREKKIPIMGVVMNGPVNTSNKEAIEHYGNVPVIAQVPFQRDLSSEILKATFDKHF